MKDDVQFEVGQLVTSTLDGRAYAPWMTHVRAGMVGKVVGHSDDGSRVMVRMIGRDAMYAFCPSLLLPAPCALRAMFLGTVGDQKGRD